MKKLRILSCSTRCGPPAGQDYSRQINPADEAEFDVAAATGPGPTRCACSASVRVSTRWSRACAPAGGRGVQPVRTLPQPSRAWTRRGRTDGDAGSALHKRLGRGAHAGAATKALSQDGAGLPGAAHPALFVCLRGLPVQRRATCASRSASSPLDEDASVGHCAAGSVVHDDPALTERVAFIHTRPQHRGHRRGVHRRSRAVCGRDRQRSAARACRPSRWYSARTPPRRTGSPPSRPSEPQVPRARGIQNCIAKNLSKELKERLAEVAVRTYQAAGLRGYGRIDVGLGARRLRSTSSRPTRIPTWPTARIWRGRGRRAASPTRS